MTLRNFETNFLFIKVSKNVHCSKEKFLKISLKAFLRTEIENSSAFFIVQAIKNTFTMSQFIVILFLLLWYKNFHHRWNSFMNIFGLWVNFHQIFMSCFSSEYLLCFVGNAEKTWRIFGEFRTKTLNNRWHLKFNVSWWAFCLPVWGLKRNQRGNFSEHFFD